MVKLQENKRLILFGLISSTILFIPFVAMQFSNEVQWSLFDFMVAGGLLFGTSLLVESVLRHVSSKTVAYAITVGILMLLLLVWVELAVGVFGTPFAGS